MKNKKNKKQKNNIRNIVNKEITRTNLRICELENEIEKQNKYLKKTLVIRNLKIFGSVCDFLLPYVLTTGFIFGFGKFINMGKPFVIDEFNKYKTYSLSYETDELIEYKENYEYNIDSDNLLKITTPWGLNKDGKYERIIKEYDVEDIKDKMIIDKLITKDIKYIDEHYNSEEINKEFTNQKLADNDYIISANLTVMDKEEVLSIKETEAKNKIYTISGGITSYLLGTLIVFLREFKLKQSLNDIISEYQNNINYLYKLESELVKEKEKIKILMKENNRANRNGGNNG